MIPEIPKREWLGENRSMRTLDDHQLTPALRAALLTARDRISQEFEVDRIVLFGSTG
jgi:hypothetical protein